MLYLHLAFTDRICEQICQWIKLISTSSINHPNQFCTLEPHKLLAIPYTYISYDLITGPLVSKGIDSIMTVIDRLIKMEHLLSCWEIVIFKQLAYLMLRHVWKLHRTPKPFSQTKEASSSHRPQMSSTITLTSDYTRWKCINPKTEVQWEISRK